MSFLVKASSLGHWVDQPAIIRRAQKPAVLVGALGGLALLAKDVFKAEPGEARRKVAIRDALVLGATAVGTLAAYKVFMRKDADVLLPKLKELGERGYDAAFLKLAKKEVKSRQEIDTLVTAIRGKAQGRKAIAADTDLVFPRAPEPTMLEDLKDEIAPFALVGLASCLSGFGGGLLANKINGTGGKEETSRMMKEGVFQFIANIFMCAVGAMIGLSVVNNKFKPVHNKIARVGVVGAGLSLGILGGGAIANTIGARWINPLINKFGSGGAQTANQPPQNDKRKIEFWDAILHLDDVPTAMVFAGVEILRPFIPLFFAFSGYRTGIGYRNGHGAKNGTPSAGQPAMAGNNPFGQPAPMPAMFNNGTVFRSFYDQRQQLHAAMPALR